MSNEDEFSKFLSLVQEMNIQVNNNSYVYFYNETGFIDRISNISETVDGLTSIPVDYKQVEEILSGKKSTNDFRVVYDSELKKYILKETRLSQEMFNPEVSKLIRLQATENADISIVQDKIKKEWKIKTSGSFKNFVVKDDQRFNKTVFFSITKENDPNVLYRFFQFTLEQLIVKTLYIAFEDDIEQTDLSVYTSNYFDSYNFEVVE